MKLQGTRKQIYEIIEVTDDAGFWGKVYDYVMMAIIAASLLPLTCKADYRVFDYVDIVAEIVFIIDYLLRLSTADFFFKKKSIGSFLRYPFTPLAIIDLLSIIPLFIALRGGAGLLRLLRVLRAFRLLRAFKAMRYSKSIMTITTVFRKQKTPLLAVATLAGGYILVSALFIFQLEPDSFKTFFDAIYWAVISVATVGYGDIVPVTAVGRTVTIVSSIFGIAVIALPAGIISVGYMEEISGENKKQDKNN